MGYRGAAGGPLPPARGLPLVMCGDAHSASLK